MNRDRGLLVVGTVKQAPAAGGTARKILKKDVVESRHDQLLSRLFYECCARLLLKNASSDSSKIRYQTKDWAGLQGGRLRAMLALCARMTKRTTIARRPVCSPVLPNET